MYSTERYDLLFAQNICTKNISLWLSIVKYNVLLQRRKDEITVMINHFSPVLLLGFLVMHHVTVHDYMWNVARNN
jgi:hypothetical protein